MQQVHNATWSVRLAKFLIAISMVALQNSITASERLYLTKFIREGRLDEARNLSRVPPTLGMDLESYAGYLTVKPSDAGHMFFWFFPALENKETAPVILWMNGGPGQSAMSGLFGEIGPYFVDKNGTVQKREVNWVSKYNVIFMDTPLGTGFSHMKTDANMSMTNEQVGKDLHSVTNQFFTIYPEFHGRDFYVAGESYAAKFAIAFTTQLMMSKSTTVNVTGLILVSSFYDPVHQMRIIDYAYEVGIIRKKFRTLQGKAETLMRDVLKVGQPQLVSKALMISSRNQNQTFKAPFMFWLNETGLKGSANIMYDGPPFVLYTFPDFLNSPSVRHALHVGDVEFNNMQNLIRPMLAEKGDLMRSARSDLQRILNAGYKVLTMAGNMDWMTTVAESMEVADALKWRCSDEFHNTERIIWRVNPADENSAGYVQCACNYCHGLVRNAGHRMPTDEPLRTLDLVDRFVKGRPFDQ